MAILHVRGVPDELHELLRKRAAAHQRSLSAEVIALLDRATGREDPAERLRENLDRLEAIRRRSKPGPKGYAADLIREMRGEIVDPSS